MRIDSINFINLQLDSRFGGKIIMHGPITFDGRTKFAPFKILEFKDSQFDVRYRDGKGDWRTVKESPDGEWIMCANWGDGWYPTITRNQTAVIFSFEDALSMMTEFMEYIDLNLGKQEEPEFAIYNYRTGEMIPQSIFGRKNGKV